MKTQLRIQEIGNLLNCRNDLEFGMSKGEAYNSLFFERTTPAHPVFRLNVEQYALSGSAFCQVTSNNFFLNHVSREIFDLIFIDGLYACDQFYTEPLNCLSHAHREVLLAIDDVYTVEAGSTMRDQGVTDRFRKNQIFGLDKTGSTAWNGDTFKILLLDIDCCADCVYAVVIGRESPQMFMWKRLANKSMDGSISNLCAQNKPVKELSEGRIARNICDSLVMVDCILSLGGCSEMLPKGEYSTSDLPSYLEMVYMDCPNS